jgi:D-psicose/D-tagatose/L-ribulose 3-epimerase
MRFAVHAYAWTSSWSSADLGLLERAAGLGLDALEIPLMELDAVEPERIRAAADAAGVELVTSTVLTEATDPTSDDEAVREAADEHLRRCVDVTAAMGAPVLGGVIYAAHGRLIDGRPERVHYERAAEVLRSAARHAGTLGVRLGIEPVNRYETFLVNTAAQGLELAELVGEDALGVHLDAYHMNIEEEEFGEPVRLVADRLVHFHLSESHRGIPGRGTVDWRAIVAALDDASYDGYVGLESFAEVSPAMRRATCIWRDLAPDSDTLVSEGLAFLKGLSRRRPAASPPARPARGDGPGRSSRA